MLGQLDGDAGGFFDRRADRIAALAGARDAHFDFADAGQVFVELAPVRRAELGFQTVSFPQDPVENAGIAPAGRGADGRVGILGPEEGFENGARVDLGRSRRGGRAPGDVVAVDATVAGIANAHHPSVFTGQLQRGNARARAELPRRDLIHRNAGADVGATRFVDVHTSEIGGSGARV